MIGTLDVLVVDDRPETVRFLVEFLVQRCRRVDVAGSVREATTAMTRRRVAKEPYHLIISDFVMPEADGLVLLRELRSRQDDTPFVFATGYRSLNPGFEPEARKLGVLEILDKPIDLKQVETLLDQTTGMFRKRREAEAKDQPFFGTSRTLRRSDAVSGAATAPSAALEPRATPPAPDPLPMPATGSWRNPEASALEPVRPPAVPPMPPVPPPGSLPPGVPLGTPPGYQRRPSAILPMGTGTARLRCSVDPAPPGSGGTGRVGRNATPQPVTGFTARVRRGGEGTASYHRQSHTESGRMVSCTACGRSFLVAARSEMYSTVCVHCGSLQRIDPA